MTGRQQVRPKGGGPAVAADLWNRRILAAGDPRELAADLASGRRRLPFAPPGGAGLAVLRPFFLDGTGQERIRQASETVLAVFRKVLDGILADDGLRRRHLSSFSRWTRGVMPLDGPGPVHAACLRFDACFAEETPVFMELNTDMPQGAGLTDAFVDFLDGIPVTAELGRRVGGAPQRIRETFLQALLGEWRASGGAGSPRIGLLTWSDEPVRRRDMELNAEHFNARGFHTAVADPRDLEFSDGVLSAGGRPFDLVYRVVSTAETLDRLEDMATLISAERDGAVLMVNSFRSELLGNKILFALVQDESLLGCLSPAEAEAVRRHIPWTRRVREETSTDPSGARIDLPAWISEHREELVLKPTHAFGGHGVTLGDACSQTEWETALGEALREEFIAQWRLPLTTGDYPVVTGEGLAIRSLYEDVDPFLLGYRYGGCLIRVSEEELTNIHAHGTMSAVYLLGEA